MHATNQYTSEYPTLMDVQTKEQHNMVVLYANSTSNQWRAMAFQTNMTIRRVERATDIATLSDGETLDFGMLQEEGHEETSGVTTDASKDILRIDDQKSETIVEYALGVTPTDDELYVGVQNPKTQFISGIQGDRLRRRSQADDLVDVGTRSTLTVTDTDTVPTTALSESPDQGLVRIDSADEGQNPIRIGFQNESGGDITPSIEALGVAYHVTPVTDSGVVEDMFHGKGHNRRVLSWGNLENDSPNIPKAWREGVIDVTAADVRNALSGGA